MIQDPKNKPVDSTTLSQPPPSPPAKAAAPPAKKKLKFRPLKRDLFPK